MLLVTVRNLTTIKPEAVLLLPAKNLHYPAQADKRSPQVRWRIHSPYSSKALLNLSACAVHASVGLSGRGGFNPLSDPSACAAARERQRRDGGREGSLVPPEIDFEAKAQDVSAEFR